MENFSGSFADEPVADIGVTAAHDPSMNRVRVVRVAPDSPAAKAGIKNGDAILSIDGVDELKVGWRRLNRMFEGPKGSKVEIVISQGGLLKRLSVERDYLING
jgi:carboxyl-terminal processing protease